MGHPDSDAIPPAWGVMPGTRAGGRSAQVSTESHPLAESGWKEKHLLEGKTMEPYHERVSSEGSLVHEWRAAQLKRLGIPWVLAEAAADNVDWHQIARLVQRGCPPELALRIVHLHPETPY